MSSYQEEMTARFWQNQSVVIHGAAEERKIEAQRQTVNDFLSTHRNRRTGKFDSFTPEQWAALTDTERAHNVAVVTEILLQEN